MQISKLVNLTFVLTLTAPTLVLAAPVTQADIVAARNAHTLQEAWITGSSASAYNIFNAFERGCDATTLSIFQYSPANSKPGSAGEFAGYACTRDGIVSVMYHTVSGGSFNAYSPHLTGTAPDGTSLPVQLKRLRDLGVVSCTGTGTWQGHPQYRSCATVTGATAGDGAPALPSGGFSDVEAIALGIDLSNYYVVTPDGYSDQIGYESDVNVTQIFGLAVSKNLYRELQVAQGIYSSVTAANLSDGSYSPANAPSLSKAQYTSIIQLSGGYQTDWSPLLGAAGIGKPINLIRHFSLSGLQEASNIYFLNSCTSGALAPASVGDSTATFKVAEFGYVALVKIVLTNHARDGKFAISLLPLENNWRDEGVDADGYRFIKLDGVHPEIGDIPNARASAVKGDYALQMEMKSFVPTSAIDTYGYTLMSELRSSLGNPSDCSHVPRGMYLNPVGGSLCGIGQEVGKGAKFGLNCSPLGLYF